jgi:hypothetical protein
MFGAIPSFAFAQPRPAAAARVETPVALAAPTSPAAPQPKVTSSGLVITGFHAVTVQTPEPSRMPEPKPPSSAGYRPWT